MIFKVIPKTEFKSKIKKKISASFKFDKLINKAFTYYFPNLCNFINNCHLFYVSLHRLSYINCQAK